MKRKTAKEILAESFKEIARKKHVDKITVKDITDQCGYSPATFYRQFRDKYDLIVWDYTRNIEAIMNQIETENTTWEKVFLDAAAYFVEEKEYLANLFLHTSGLDSFISAMTQISFDYLNRWLVNKKNETRLDLEEELLLRAYCLGTANLTCEWILGKVTCTTKQLSQIYLDALPARIKKEIEE